MAELIEVTNTLFRNKKNWINITDEDKEKYFFIINRLLSKKYPKEAQLLNHKNINKISALDTWYYFMLDKPYPNWFWSKSKKGKESKKDINESDYKLLLEKFKIKDIDLDFLIEKKLDFIKEELSYFKKIINQK